MGGTINQVNLSQLVKVRSVADEASNSDGSLRTCAYISDQICFFFYLRLPSFNYRHHSSFISPGAVQSDLHVPLCIFSSHLGGAYRGKSREVDMLSSARRAQSQHL